MFEHIKMQSPEDFFTPLQNRPERGVYFYRMNGYSEKLLPFLEKYYEAAERGGIVAEGKIPNPDEKNLAYYDEIMGRDFRLDTGFFEQSLKKWLPRMDGPQRADIAAGIYGSLSELKKTGKNEAMLKNAYIKCMCWLYYKFERILNMLGRDNVPKILYEGDIGRYELMLLTVLSGAGCDTLLLQYSGAENDKKMENIAAASDLFTEDGEMPFPKGFCRKQLRERQQAKLAQERLYGERPRFKSGADTWTENKSGFEMLLTAPENRGAEQDTWYNLFLAIKGVEDKLTYLNELYRLQMELKNRGRAPVIIQGAIPPPAMEEIQAVHRKNYASDVQMLQDLAGQISFAGGRELQKAMRAAFLDVLLPEKDAALINININKLTNAAVYLLCWLRRYQAQLFSGWKMPEISCFFYLGGCKSEKEALFLRMLARLPVDVVLFMPDRSDGNVLKDDRLLEICYEDSMEVRRFPTDNGEARIGTAAYHAERELDAVMYQDSGIYRNKQYCHASSVTLQTMYEEIAILWQQELKYRPNFNASGDTVTLPVLFAKVSGVKDGAVGAYWSGIKALLTKDAYLISDAPFIKPSDENPIRAHVTGFLKNGRLQRDKIRAAKAYPYGVLREETQDYLLDKLQLLLDNRMIEGTFENGTEYTVIATVLNMKKEIVRLLQQFDFTKINPKLIYINTAETPISLEDTILAAFLNLAGFDIVFFVPTGYRTVERYFNRSFFMEEHQIGDYLYDLKTPDFRLVTTGGARRSWRDRIFKRGT